MSHLDRTAADKTSIGYEYQDLACIEKLLCMKQGEKVGIEILDDIHTELLSGETFIIQVKHSLNASNISERDIDLWKTIYNWHIAFDELPTGKEYKFILLTNKGFSGQEFIKLLMSQPKDIQKIREKIHEILIDLIAKEDSKKKGSTENPILKYVKYLSEDTNRNLESILNNIELIEDDSQILNRIDELISFFAVNDAKVAHTRNTLIGSFKAFKFEQTKSNKKIEIDYDTFRINIGFNRILHLASSISIDFDKYYDYRNIYDISIKESPFGIQLSDIGITDPEIIEHGMSMVRTEEFINDLILQGCFSEIENTRLEHKAQDKWSFIFMGAYSQGDPKDDQEHNSKAKDCFRATLSSDLSANASPLPPEMCRGKFTKLSNTPSIGWRKDWERKYKK